MSEDRNATGYRLRRAMAADAGTLTALARRSKASNGYDAAFMRACEAELTYTPDTIAGGETWLAEDESSRILGFLDLRPCGGEAEVYAMFVEPGLKREGVGRALWRKAEESARAMSLGAIGLDADPNAVPFYAAMGMEVVGTSPSGSIPGRSLPRMRKILGPSIPSTVSIEAVSRIDLKLAAHDWPFAAERRDEIEAHWRRLKADRLRIWNGRVILTRDVRIDRGRFEGTCFLADYSAFIAWRDWGWPDRTVADCFGTALILSRDGALICGRMAETTMNAGRIYPPCGTLDPRDVLPNGRIDIAGSLSRELMEETGLQASEAVPGGLWCVRDGCRICLARELRFHDDADTIAERAEAFIAAQERPELAALVVLRSVSDISPAMPSYAARLAQHFLG